MDVVVDVSAYATEPAAGALDYVKPGGTIVLAGVKGHRPVPDFISDKIVMKEISIRGAIGVTTTGYAQAIRVIESRNLPRPRSCRAALDPLVSAAPFRVARRPP